ncbi:hypothetical protein DEO72_LG6g170 [Vigna unguiculata]|uniref:Uncharacterized protein n=1 Tax=Vigna unguiculata TaxID=3917 RepID=A0A4D6M3R0_VIGUN|nr:hypothetical protein DEO72_LG6g170 [Vigna unguiculata]
MTCQVGTSAYVDITEREIKGSGVRKETGADAVVEGDETGADGVGVGKETRVDAEVQCDEAGADGQPPPTPMTQPTQSSQQPPPTPMTQPTLSSQQPPQSSQQPHPCQLPIPRPTIPNRRQKLQHRRGRVWKP